MQNYYELPQCTARVKVVHTWEVLEMIDWLEERNYRFVFSGGEICIKEYKYQRRAGEMTRLRLDHIPTFKFWDDNVSKEFKLTFVKYLVIPRFVSEEDQ